MVDATDLKSVDCNGREGSSPSAPIFIYENASDLCNLKFSFAGTARLCSQSHKSPIIVKFMSNKS